MAVKGNAPLDMTAAKAAMVVALVLSHGPLLFASYVANRRGWQLLAISILLAVLFSNGWHVCAYEATPDIPRLCAPLLFADRLGIIVCVYGVLSVRTTVPRLFIWACAAVAVASIVLERPSWMIGLPAVVVILAQFLFEHHTNTKGLLLGVTLGGAGLAVYYYAPVEGDFLVAMAFHIVWHILVGISAQHLLLTAWHPQEWMVPKEEEVEDVVPLEPYMPYVQN